MKLTDAQYAAALSMFNECNEYFWELPQKFLDAFFDRLYRK